MSNLKLSLRHSAFCHTDFYSYLFFVSHIILLDLLKKYNFDLFRNNELLRIYVQDHEKKTPFTIKKSRPSPLNEI